MSPKSNNNTFFGIRVSQPGINVNNASPSQLMYSNDYSKETFYGNGSAAVTIGNLGNSAYGMSIPASNGTINFGLLSSGNLGMQVLSTSGSTLFEMDGQTWYWYDNSGNNVMQVGLLPNGQFGWAVATAGNSVSSAFN